MKKEKPIYKFNSPHGFSKNVVFVVGTYVNNNNIYVGLEEADTGEPFTDITRNLGEKMQSYGAYIKNDVENDGMLQFLIEDDLGVMMGNSTVRFSESILNYSCREFFFNAFRLSEADPEGVKNYEKTIKK